ncbi:MAG: hypothetical protein ACJ8KA_11240 [Sulfurifustis sp.]
MSALHVASGFAGLALLASAVVCRLVCRLRLPWAARAAIAIAAGALIFVPAGDLLLVEYARGVLGDLSITGQVLLVAYIASYVSGRSLIDERNINTVMFAIVGAALLLYPLALGLTYFDPYALGYRSAYFATALLFGTLVAWYAGRYWLVVCVVLALACYTLRVLESDNVWDYLIDPLTAIYALGWTLSLFAVSIVRRRRKPQPS